MSVVGPRPLLVKYLPLYNEHQARRHEVRPGFTGYAQANGRNALSWKLLGTSLLDTAYMDLTQLAVGKIYAPGELALYNRGRQYPGLLVISINSSIESVIFPTLSRVQDDIGRLKEMTRWAIKIGIFVMGPAMLGLACMAEPLVRLMLTDKWIGCVFYLRVYCVIYMFMPVITTNINAIKAIGNSKLVLQLEVIKKIISISVLFIVVGISVKALVIKKLKKARRYALTDNIKNKTKKDIYFFCHVLK